MSSPVIKPNRFFDIFQYWSLSNYKNLKRFALDLLTIPASSSAVERAFSIAADDDVPKRRRMCPEKFSKLQRLNSYTREKI